MTSVTGKRWGKRLAITAVVVWGLWVLVGTPWEPYQLWHDATHSEALFREVANLDPLQIGTTTSEAKLQQLGYYNIEHDHGVVFFYHYRRFRSKGMFGVAHAPDKTIPPEINEWAYVFSTPPHWPMLRMPDGFFIFGGK